VLLALILIIFFLFCYLMLIFFAKKEFDIFYVYLLPWILSLITFVISINYSPSFDFFTLIGIEELVWQSVLYLLGINSLFLASIVLGMRFRFLRKETNIIRYRPKLIYYILLLIAILSFIYDFSTNLETYFSPVSIYELRTNSDEESSRLFASLYFYLSLICFPVSIWLMMSKGINFIRVIPVALLFVSALANLSKFIILFIVAYWVVNVFIDSGQFYINKKRSTRFGLRLFGFLLLIIISVTAFRSQNKTSDTKLVPTLFAYFGGYIPSFSDFYFEKSTCNLSTEPSFKGYDRVSSRFGNQTFAGIYRISNQLGLASNGASVHYTGVFNVYTLYRDVITDFGVFGSYVFMSCLGFFFGILRVNLNKKSFIGLHIITLIGVFLFFTLFYSIFGFSFFYLVLFVSPTLIKKVKE
jgi:oligosaccharide repeat unit polymerase